MIDKIVRSMAEALDGVADGAVVLFGGFGQVGQPNHLIDGLIERGTREIVAVANNSGSGEAGLAKLMALGRVRRIVCSFPRSRGSVVFEDLYRAGRIELEMVPQGTLAERMRAAGAGIAAFYTPTAAGTKLAEGKETREIDGRLHVLEHALSGDVALIEAWQADRWGNLTYYSGRQLQSGDGDGGAADGGADTARGRSRGARSGGDRDARHLCRSRAARAVRRANGDLKRLHDLRKTGSHFYGVHVAEGGSAEGGSRERGRAGSCRLQASGAQKLQRALPAGTFRKAGTSISASARRCRSPTMCRNSAKSCSQSENGILGMGPAPAPDKINRWLINAGKQYITLRTGGCLHAPRRQLGLSNWHSPYSFLRGLEKLLHTFGIALAGRDGHRDGVADFFPNNASPTGDSSLILSLIGLASTGDTSLNSQSSALSTKRTVTMEPRPTRSVEISHYPADERSA